MRIAVPEDANPAMTAHFLQPRAVQSTTFSPRLQHAVRLLQMSSQDFERLLADEVQSNPFLELVEPDVVVALEESDERAAYEEDATWASEGEHAASGTGPRGANADHDPDALQTLVAPTTLSMHLQPQLGAMRLTSRERVLASTVAQALDDDGYLRMSLEELAGLWSAGSSVTKYEVEAALARVQACDPPGVGARTVAECLSLQLLQQPPSPCRDLAERAVREHLALLASHHLPRLALALDASEDAVREAVRLIRRLEARPGLLRGGEVARAITPDVTVRKLRGRWVAKLNASALPHIQLHPATAALAQHDRASLNPELLACLDKARWTVQNLNQRLSTILRIARAIVAQQQLFLDHGPLAMKPLGLRDIADAVSVHPSTVSRTVRGKYLATPWGVYEMRHFFSRGMTHSTGSACAPVALRSLLSDMIVAESADARLSDAELTRQLAQQGFRIARRTVTKYRQELGVAPLERRRAGWRA